MKKTLKTILRIKDHEMLALRKEGYQLQEQVHTIELAIRARQHEQEIEIKLAEHDPHLRDELMAYIEVSENQILRLNKGLKSAIAVLEAHQDKMHEKFAEIKTFEQALEQYIEKERQNALHTEQKSLDEMAQSRFIQNKKHMQTT